MKTTLLFIAGALLAVPVEERASVSSSPQSSGATSESTGVKNSGPLYQLRLQIEASAAAFQQGSDATALQYLATPALPADATAVQNQMELGWRLCLVAQRLVGVRDFATARHAATLAISYFNGPPMASATNAQMAQVMELAGSLSEHVFNDRTTALQDYQSAVSLDPTRGISAARIKVLQAAQAQAAATPRH